MLVIEDGLTSPSFNSIYKQYTLPYSNIEDGLASPSFNSVYQYAQPYSNSGSTSNTKYTTSSSSYTNPVYVNSKSTKTKYRASPTESCSRSALSLLPSVGGSVYCTSSCYSILGRENADKCCQSADSIEAYPVTCYPCKLCAF